MAFRNEARLTPFRHHRARYAQKQRATSGKRIRLDKRLLQPRATLGNTVNRIVAPKGAGSSPVGHPPRFGIAKQNRWKGKVSRFEH